MKYNIIDSDSNIWIGCVKAKTYEELKNGICNICTEFMNFEPCSVDDFELPEMIFNELKPPTTRVRCNEEVFDVKITL